MLLTRSPLSGILLPLTFDLHVLSTPPAFILSQDQTLHSDPSRMASSHPYRFSHSRFHQPAPLPQHQPTSTPERSLSCCLTTLQLLMCPLSRLAARLRPPQPPASPPTGLRRRKTVLYPRPRHPVKSPAAVAHSLPAHPPTTHAFDALRHEPLAYHRQTPSRKSTPPPRNLYLLLACQCPTRRTRPLSLPQPRQAQVDRLSHPHPHVKSLNPLLPSSSRSASQSLAQATKTSPAQQLSRRKHESPESFGWNDGGADLLVKAPNTTHQTNTLADFIAVGSVSIADARSVCQPIQAQSTAHSVRHADLAQPTLT